jgi:hypothetical protein
MYVRSVARPLLHPVAFRDIKEFTVQGSFMCVSSVGKPSFPLPLEGMK